MTRARARAELSRLHAGRARRAARRVGRSTSSARWRSSRTTARISTAWAGRTSRTASSISPRTASSAPPTSSRPTRSCRTITATCSSGWVATRKRSTRGRGRCSGDGEDIDRGRHRQEDPLGQAEASQAMIRRSPAGGTLVCLLAALDRILVRRAADERCRRAPARRRPTRPTRFAQATAAAVASPRSPPNSRSAARAGGQRLRGAPGLGLAAPASARLEAPAPFGASLFIFAARERRRDAAAAARPARPASRASPAAVLEAVTGVPLDASGAARCADRLRVDSRRRPAAGSNSAIDWRDAADGSHRNRVPETCVLERSVAAGRRRRTRGARRPMARRVSRLRRRPAADDPSRQQRCQDAFDLRLALSQVELNPQLGPEVFEVRVPPSAQPITLDELAPRWSASDEPRE